MKNPRLFVKQHPVAVFLVLAFFLSWWPSLLYVLHIGNFPPILPLGPLLAALIVLPLAGGWAAIREFGRRIFHWRAGIGWWVVAIGFPILVSAAAAGANILMGAAATRSLMPISLSALALASLDSLLWVGLGEEAGWSGFALPRLLRSRSFIAVVIILGTVRALWHLPLFLAGQQDWIVALSLFPVQLIFTWIFIRTRGSALLLILAHVSQNVVGSMFFSLFSGPDLTRMYGLWTVGLFALAGFALWRVGPAARQTFDESPTRELVEVRSVPSA